MKGKIPKVETSNSDQNPQDCPRPKSKKGNPYKGDRCEIILEREVQDMIREKIGNAHGVGTYIRSLVYDSLNLPMPCKVTKEVDPDIDLRHVIVEFLPVVERAVVTMFLEGYTSYDIMVMLKTQGVQCRSKEGWSRKRVIALLDRAADRERKRQQKQAAFLSREGIE